jgi:hypothetical protein
MTRREKLARAKMSLIELTEYLKNVSEACRVMGVSRQHFYDIKKAYVDGEMPALQEKSRRKPNLKNHVAPEIEAAVVRTGEEYSAYGQLRAADALRKDGVLISPYGVRSIWLRHGLETFKKRLVRLEDSYSGKADLLLRLGIRHLLIDHLATLIHRAIINPAGHVIGGPGNSHGPGAHWHGTHHRGAAVRALNGCPPWAHISLSAPGAFCVSSAGSCSHRSSPGVHIIPWGGSHGIAPGANRGRSPGASYRCSPSRTCCSNPGLCISYQHGSQRTDW